METTEPHRKEDGMKIRNTEVEAHHPWPDGMLVQGGGTGVVLRATKQGGTYRTAFVEAFPGGTFLRGEGETIPEAEDACWRKYQLHVSCDGSGEHGPYEPRHYENGCGFCVKCGAWFTGVCTPSVNHQINSLACQRVQAQWGTEVVGLRGKWSGLVKDEEARIRAFVFGIEEAAPTTEDPTEEELTGARSFHGDSKLTDDEAAQLRVAADIFLARLADSLPAGP